MTEPAKRLICFYCARNLPAEHPDAQNGCWRSGCRERKFAKLAERDNHDPGFCWL